MRIGLVFFGITRSLRFTISSIEKNVIEPARRTGETKLFAHFFNQELIDNPRSGEKGTLDPNEHLLLPVDDLIIEEPNLCLQEQNFNQLSAFGDLWNDDYRSLRNLVHQLHSMENAVERALKWNPDIVIFARPDLKYHDSLAPILRKANDASAETAFLPYWQAHGGLNDRFAVLRGENVTRSYGTRIRRAIEYCTYRHRAVGAEELLEFALLDWPVVHFGQRASRVRFDGKMRYERFDHPMTWNLISFLTDGISNVFLKRSIHKLIYIGQATAIGPRYRGLK